MELLKDINLPSELRALDRSQLPQLADELRAFVLESVSKTGGHLSSNLGTVELTIALHYVFDTPEDRLVWDVGHQTYPHKILTGRREQMARLRQHGGMSGFRGAPKANRHVRNCALINVDLRSARVAVAAYQGSARHSIAVIGDGAMRQGWRSRH